MSPDAYVYTRVRANKSRMVRKIYAAFYLKYISSNPFSLKIVYKVVFVNPDAYVYTRVRVRKIRMAPKIYAVIFGFIFWFYISMPFSVKIWCKTGFPSPDAYVYTRVWVRKIRMAPKIYAKPSFFAISAVFNSSNLDTPFSCIVTPYSTSASSMVPRRWVIKMNWVFLVIRRTY